MIKISGTKANKNLRFITSLMLVGLIQFDSFGSIISSGLPSCYAQGEGKVQSVAMDFVTEGGCPIGITESSAQLEVDPFNAPVAIRIFLTYQNNGPKNLVAAKFRFRFLDSDEKDRGTFQASDAKGAAAGQTGSEKWRKVGMDPHTTHLKARVLAVKFEDGTSWESEKFGEYVPATTDGSGGNGAPQSPPAVINQPAEGFSNDDNAGQSTPPLQPQVDQLRLHQE